jgi:hypothetical protein
MIRTTRAKTRLATAPTTKAYTGPQAISTQAPIAGPRMRPTLTGTMLRDMASGSSAWLTIRGTTEFSAGPPTANPIPTPVVAAAMTATSLQPPRTSPHATHRCQRQTASRAQQPSDNQLLHRVTAVRDRAAPRSEEQLRREERSPHERDSDGGPSRLVGKHRGDQRMDQHA